MSPSFKSSLGGIVILSLLLPGCAGGGLKNMFSRDDTAGYRTLEEIEADEAKKAERETAIADADGDKPRFSPWLPFGKKADESATSDESLAATEPSDDEVSPKYGKWWQRAFRTRDPYESDPFLAEGNDIAKDEDTDSVAGTKKPEARTVSAESETNPLTKPETASSKSKNVDTKVSDTKNSDPTKKDSNIRPVSGTRNVINADKSEDELLVEKFEQQFRNNTLAAAETMDEAEPLIVAGKSKAEATAKDTKSAVQKTSAAKLNELEELLAERRTSAAKATRQKQAEAKSKASSELAKTASVADEFVLDASVTESTTRKKASTAAKTVDSNMSGFDRLLMEANGELPAELPAPKSKTSVPAKPASKTTASKKTPSSDDVQVASAEELFGMESTTGQKSARKSRTVSKPSPAKSKDDDGFEWQQSQRDDREPAAETDEQESLIASDDAISSDSQPVPSTRSKRDTSTKTRSGNASATMAQESRQQASPFRVVSNSRPVNEPAPRQADGLRPFVLPPPSSGTFGSDGFFTQAQIDVAPSAPTTMATQKPGTKASDEASPVMSGGFQMTSRHWMLLIGGLIVVALLFAPGSKKQLSAGSSAVQG